MEFCFFLFGEFYISKSDCRTLEAFLYFLSEKIPVKVLLFDNIRLIKKKERKRQI